ncbi:hypothetical protein OUZ56_030083 [Daphnia magna]|uniref:Uncharacterized protein n=1 Tax=Daphnia magna TaxID=35525 RepID=A0ABQ9ZQ91_9CRUS|nr:hypothetical protein OUZ56_030083 [Daphnia magna]
MAPAQLANDIVWIMEEIADLHWMVATWKRDERTTTQTTKVENGSNEVGLNPNRPTHTTYYRKQLGQDVSLFDVSKKRNAQEIQFK